MLDVATTPNPTQLSRRRVLRAAVVTAFLAPLASCSSGKSTSHANSAASTAASPAASAGGKFLQIDGATNVRDLGGYAAGGRPIVTGRIFRSGSLNRLTQTGSGQLSALKLANVVDFRADAERAGRADLLPAGVASVPEPVSGAATGRSGPPTGGLSAADPATKEEFRSYVTSAASRASFGAALRLLASSDTPMLWHCNSGTYRTGWATAVLLTALGVPRAQVYADFLLSNQAFGATYAFADYLDVAFDAATSAFGSFAGYLEHGLGVGTDVQDRLKRALLSP